MQTQYISFCNNNALNIKSNFLKTQILTELQDKYELKIIDKHHEIFCEDKHMNRLLKVPHVTSLKTNGNPYFMYLTNLSGVNSIVMIDKKIQMGYSLPRMIIIKLKINDGTLFTNTLFEGEMVHDKNDTWLFLITDLHVLRNKSLKTNEDLFKRINMTFIILQNHFVAHFQDLFAIQVKKYVPLCDINWLYRDFAKTLPYSIRGLYLKPIYNKFKDILLNVNDNLVKNTIKEKYGKQSHFLTNSNEILQKVEIQNKNFNKNFNENKNEVDINININNNFNKVQESKDEIVFIELDDDIDNTKIFCLQKSETPDLYKLFSQEGVSHGFACVDSMKTSKMLNASFFRTSMLTKLKFMCEKTTNSRFKNIWVPIKMM
jgi:hypothetical protein